MVRPILSASTGSIGLGPYGDESEHAGVPEVILLPSPYRPFFDTDARSVLVTLIPNHYNMIPNPAFRSSIDGWYVAASPDWTLSDDSWVGKSIRVSGNGLVRYVGPRNNFVWVGPLVGTDVRQWDPRRSGSEWTFSAYVKGSGEVRLKMDAYNPEDREDLLSGPEFQNLPTVNSPWTEPLGRSALLDTEGQVWVPIDPKPASAPFYESLGRGPAVATVSGEWTSIDDDGEWHRVILKTRARVPENEGRVSFVGARWIDTQVEFRSANGLHVSALMLDPNEYPTCDYFDGGITENFFLDDFLWEGEANNSVSYYYFDRVSRVAWLYDRMGYVIPAGRPYQIFFGSYWRPYVGTTKTTTLLEVPSTEDGYDWVTLELAPFVGDDTAAIIPESGPPDITYDDVIIRVKVTGVVQDPILSVWNEATGSVDKVPELVAGWWTATFTQWASLVGDSRVTLEDGSGTGTFVPMTKAQAVTLSTAPVCSMYTPVPFEENPGLPINTGEWIPTGSGTWYVKVAETPSTLFITRWSGEWAEELTAQATFVDGWWVCPDDRRGASPMTPATLWAVSALGHAPYNEIGTYYTLTDVRWCPPGEVPSVVPEGSKDCDLYPPPYRSSQGGDGTDYAEIFWSDVPKRYHVKVLDDPAPSTVWVYLYAQDSDEAQVQATWDGEWWVAEIRASTGIPCNLSANTGSDYSGTALALADIQICPVPQPT